MISKNVSPSHPIRETDGNTVLGNEVNSLCYNATPVLIKPVKNTDVPQMRLLFSQDELEQSKIANRLVDAIEHEMVATPGQMNGWCNSLWFLQSDWKDYVWERLSQSIDHAQFKQLYGLYRSNVARYTSDMERRKARKRRSEGAGE